MYSIYLTYLISDSKEVHGVMVSNKRSQIYLDVLIYIINHFSLNEITRFKIKKNKESVTRKKKFDVYLKKNKHIVDLLLLLFLIYSC